MDIPWRRVAAPPRGATWIFRGGDAAAATQIFRGGDAAAATRISRRVARPRALGSRCGCAGAKPLSRAFRDKSQSGCVELERWSQHVEALASRPRARGERRRTCGNANKPIDLLHSEIQFPCDAAPALAAAVVGLGVVVVAGDAAATAARVARARDFATWWAGLPGAGATPPVWTYTIDPAAGAPATPILRTFRSRFAEELVPSDFHNASLPSATYRRRADVSPMNRGDAAAATLIFGGDKLHAGSSADGSWRRRGYDVDISSRPVHASGTTASTGAARISSWTGRRTCNDD